MWGEALEHLSSLICAPLAVPRDPEWQHHQTRQGPMALPFEVPVPPLEVPCGAVIRCPQGQNPGPTFSSLIGL